MKIKEFILEDIVPLHIFVMFVPDATYWTENNKGDMVAEMCNSDLVRLFETKKIKWYQNTRTIWRHYGLSTANEKI